MKSFLLAFLCLVLPLFAHANPVEAKKCAQLKAIESTGVSVRQPNYNWASVKASGVELTNQATDESCMWILG